MKNYYCTIFKTRRGYFGLCCTEKGIYRTCLPLKTRRKVEEILTKGLKNAAFQKSLLSPLLERISAYYEGAYVDFSKEKTDLSGYSQFSQKILLACAKIKYGKTMTYKQLAKVSGCPASARAVGGVMSRNRIPLIIPCHRVIGSDGLLHGFSAPGGIETKKKMLLLEKVL
jgi:methylated-DNA-[protein]-cysteine S-methyltransferase